MIHLYTSPDGIRRVFSRTTGGAQWTASALNDLNTALKNMTPVQRFEELRNGNIGRAIEILNAVVLTDSVRKHSEEDLIGYMRSVSALI